MNFSQTNSLLKQIKDKTDTNNTNLNTLETTLTNIESSVGGTLDVDITSLTGFTKGITNTGAGTLNVVNATDDPNLSAMNTSLDNIESELIDIGITMSHKDQYIWQLKKNNSDVYDTDTAGTGNRFYYITNNTGGDVFVKYIYFTYITTSNVLSYDGILDNADNANQFRFGKSTATNTIDTWYSEIGATALLWPFLVSESQLNDGSGNYIYAFKVPVNYSVPNSDYVMVKIHNTFDADMTAFTFQALVEY